MKRRRINKRMLYITLSVMIISVFTLTIAYAVLSTTLNITGSAEISDSSWGLTLSEVDVDEVYIESTFNGYLSEGYKIEGNTKVRGDGQIIKKNTISGMSLDDGFYSFTKPGDSVSLYYIITNNGSIPAKLDSMVYIYPSVTSSTNNSSDLEWFENEFNAHVSLAELKNFNGGFTKGDILCPGSSIYLKVHLGIDEEATVVSSSNIAIDNFGATFNFVQADKSTCSSS